MKRGEIWTLQDKNYASKARPVVIIQDDAVSEQETMTAEKCLLYVAMTRAQKGAYVSGYGQMTEFLK